MITIKKKISLKENYLEMFHQIIYKMLVNGKKKWNKKMNVLNIIQKFKIMNYLIIIIYINKMKRTQHCIEIFHQIIFKNRIRQNYIEIFHQIIYRILLNKKTRCNKKSNILDNI